MAYVSRSFQIFQTSLVPLFHCQHEQSTQSFLLAILLNREDFTLQEEKYGKQ